MLKLEIVILCELSSKDRNVERERYGLFRWIRMRIDYLALMDASSACYYMTGLGTYRVLHRVWATAQLRGRIFGFFCSYPYWTAIIRIDTESTYTHRLCIDPRRVPAVKRLQFSQPALLRNRIFFELGNTIITATRTY